MLDHSMAAPLVSLSLWPSSLGLDPGLSLKNLG